MYFLDDIKQLNEARIVQIIRMFMMNDKPLLERYEKYYENKDNDEANVNYCYSIVQTYCGYLSGVPISYTSAEDIGDILEILRYNDYHAEDNDLLESALVYGISYELNYLDEEAQQRFTHLDSKEVIPIYSNDIQKKLIAAIRIYDANDYSVQWLSDLNKKHFCDVYTDTKIIHYEYQYGSLKFLSEERHYFGMVPITVFELNKKRKSIFDQVMSLQDAYNRLLNANIGDYESFVDAFLIVQGAYLDDETLTDAQNGKRVLNIPDSDSVIKYLTKPDSSTGIKNLLDNIEEKIKRIAQAPDFADESFGTSSGIAIRYKLTGMETVCANIETNMKKALQKRLELICAIQRLTASDFTWRDVEIVFTRNLPVNELEEAQMVNQLRGLVSNKTLLSQLNFITDVDAELEALKEQEEPLYNFNFEESEV